MALPVFFPPQVNTPHRKYSFVENLPTENTLLLKISPRKYSFVENLPPENTHPPKNLSPSHGWLISDHFRLIKKRLELFVSGLMSIIQNICDPYAEVWMMKGQSPFANIAV